MTGIIVCGLPNSGKTTLLAALYYQLTMGQIKTTLEVASVAVDNSHLTDLATQWADVKVVAHTRESDDKYVDMNLRWPECPDKETVPVHFSDLSGEGLRAQYVERTCTSEYARFAEQASGIALLIHSDQFDSPLPLSAVKALAAPPKSDKSLKADSSAQKDASLVDATAPVMKVGTQEAEEHTRKPTSAKTSKRNPTPTQVELVGILQFLTSDPNPISSARRIAVILSAWDLVRDVGTTPDEWLKDSFPLLHQFLHKSPNLETAVFGISALGGHIPDNPKDDAKRREVQDSLRSVDPPSNRPTVVAADGSTRNDLSIPFAWLMS